LSSEKWNKPVDEEFMNLAKSIPNYDRLFASAPPEHQWEGKYRLKQGDVFVEAGAFWGKYGLIASKRVGSKGRVILIEGNPYNLKMLQHVVQSYNLSNVEIVEGIVWSEDGTKKFYIAGNPVASKVANKDDLTNFPGEIIDVKAYSLDSLLRQLQVDHVDLLAADVEGAEVEMVKGADRYFTEKRIRHVAIAAYHNQDMFPEIIIRILKSKGYKDLDYRDMYMPHYGGIVYGHV